MGRRAVEQPIDADPGGPQQRGLQRGLVPIGDSLHRGRLLAKRGRAAGDRGRRLFGMRPRALGIALGVTWALGACAPAANATGWSLEQAANATRPAGSLAGVSCVSDTSCVGVGGSLAEHWDGISWTIVPTASDPAADSSSLNDVSCTAPTDC